MNCPVCNHPDVYVGLSKVECQNSECRYGPPKDEEMKIEDFKTFFKATEVALTTPEFLVLAALLRGEHYPSRIYDLVEEKGLAEEGELTKAGLKWVEYVNDICDLVVKPELERQQTSESTPQ